MCVHACAHVSGRECVFASTFLYVWKRVCVCVCVCVCVFTCICTCTDSKEGQMLHGFHACFIVDTGIAVTLDHCPALRIMDERKCR